ncbi:MAG TPA: tetratricopeptide repeat protein [Polyangiaceae bacterium]
MTPAQAFELALGHHRAGRIAEAEALYRSVLERQPDHHQAFHLSSLLALEAGKLEGALELGRRAYELQPSNAGYLASVGEIERHLGRLDAAAETLLRALALEPNLVQASFNLGLVLQAKGDTLGALARLERAADLEPRLFLVQHALAQVLESRGELTGAIGHYHAALALDPESVEAHEDLAWVLRRVGRLEGAFVAARRALELAPDSAAAALALGAVLLDRQEVDEATNALRLAERLSPGLASAHSFLANALREAGQSSRALEHYRRALELDVADPATHSNLVFTMAYAPEAKAEDILAEARSWNAQHAGSLAAEQRPHSNTRDPERRLRIGYVSPDFRDHVQVLFTLPLFRNHHRRAFEIVCYSSVERPDAVTQEIRAVADGWRDARALDDGRLAELVRSDGIDLLVDLTMHMADGRPALFARKPAPVQLCWLAYPGTTGLPAMDYRFTDPHLDPETSNDGVYSEESVRLRETFWCYEPRAKGLEPGPLPAGEDRVVTFGCLNTFCKVHDGVIDLFARVLRGVAGSRMVILAPAGETRRRVAAHFARKGVDEQRITFVGRVPRREYLMRYREIDLCLDTFPYNGHTTSLDAFWMGAPVVTLVGDTVVGRAGLSQAMNLGLPELIARTPDEYVERAVALAKDRSKLAALRAGLRARMESSPLMDSKRFTENVEAAYRSLWRRYCASG